MVVHQILRRNTHVGHGEIDILAKDHSQTVFVEVKTRSDKRTGFPEDVVNSLKLKHLQQSIETYFGEHDEIDDNWRMDVISVNGNPDSPDYQIEWFIHATS